MMHVITYTNNYDGFKSWLAANVNNYPAIAQSDDGSHKLTYPKMRPFVKGSYSVAICAVDSLDTLNASPLEILGQGVCGTDTCPHMQVAADPTKVAKVQAAGVQDPIPVYDDNGTQTGTYTPPLNFGGFI